MNVTMLAIAGFILIPLSYFVGWVVGDSGARRILKALDERHRRAEIFAIRATRERLKAAAASINHEMDCASALEVARRAYYRDKD